jgi:hypothetical protein
MNGVCDPPTFAEQFVQLVAASFVAVPVGYVLAGVFSFLWSAAIRARWRLMR